MCRLSYQDHLLHVFSSFCCSVSGLCYLQSWAHSNRRVERMYTESWMAWWRQRERMEDNLQKKKEMVRDGSMALGEIKGPHVIFHLFMSFLFSFVSSSFVMVLMWSAFMPAPQGHSRTEPLQPTGALPVLPIHPSIIRLSPSLHPCQHHFTPLPLKLHHEGPCCIARLNNSHVYCPVAQNDPPKMLAGGW